MIRALPLSFLLAACGEANPPMAQAAGVNIPCALSGDDGFASACKVSRSQSDAGAMLTISAPSGSFRRLRVSADGSTIAAADGSEAARVVAGPAGAVEIAIAADRYRLPAANK